MKGIRLGVVSNDAEDGITGLSHVGTNLAHDAGIVRVGHPSRGKGHPLLDIVVLGLREIGDLGHHPDRVGNRLRVRVAETDVGGPVDRST